MSIRTRVLNFKKGDIIFSAGDSANCAYIIEQGRVGLYPLTQQDEKIADLGKGELLGEMGIINNLNRSVSAYAENSVELLVVDREQITSRLENADPILRGVLEVLLSRIRKMLGANKLTNHSRDSNNTIVTEGMTKIRFEHEMFEALENDEIVNVYQPMVNLSDNTVAGFEALSRWKHPEKGMVSPFEFITLAEESDFIVPMGLKIFDSACKQLSLFQNKRSQVHPQSSPLFMSINVSPTQLSSDGFLEKIMAITQNHQINPADVKIEITESLMVDYKQVKSWIDECSHFGFKLSLDDFGTGHSGFEHLLQLDFDAIKIDQIFVKTIETNPKSLIMLELITQMAKRMNMSVVAEGIEDKKSAQILKKMGVDYGQGYYFYKPMNASEIDAII